MSGHETKQGLRKEVRRRIAELPQSTATAEAEACAKKLFTLARWRKAKSVLAFISMAGEIGTRRILEAAIAEKKRICLPRMHGREMEFHLVHEPGQETGPAEGTARSDLTTLMNTLERHPYGVMEAPEDFPLFDSAVHTPALVVTPGLAFDRKGRRLGRGRGYYDRWFTRHEREIAEGLITQAAIGFTPQLFEEVPVDENDRFVSLLIIGGEVLRAE
jgi:5-formyltetrahydrofolate cyclo-ligase